MFVSLALQQQQQQDSNGADGGSGLSRTHSDSVNAGAAGSASANGNAAKLDPVLRIQSELSAAALSDISSPNSVTRRSGLATPSVSFHLAHCAILFPPSILFPTI